MRDLEPLLPGTHRDPNTTWTRVVADEFWGDAVTPFQFSALGQWIDTYTSKATDRLTGANSIPADLATLRLYRSHVYWNADVIARNIDAIPKFVRTEQLLSYYPPDWRPGLAAAPFRPWKRVGADRKSRRADPDSAIDRNHVALEEHATQVDRVCDDFDLIDLGSAGEEELDSIFQRLFDLGIRHFEIIRWGLSNHAFGMNVFLGAILRRWLGDDGTLHRALISGLALNHTFVTNAEIWRLGRIVAADPELRQALLSQSPPTFEELSAGESGRRFAKEIDQFLAGFGHRGSTRDISAPRWIETPDAVLEMVGVAARAPEDADPIANFEAEARAREEAEARVEQALGGWRSKLKLRTFRRVARYAQIYTRYRENQRFALDKILLRVRRVVIAMGETLANRGLIQQPDDIFFLTHDEANVLRAATLDGTLARELVGLRRAAFERDKDVLPPAYLRGDEPIVVESPATGSLMTGIPASPGSAEGVARVIRSPREAPRLRPGDILVATTTDPGWTPLFLGIGGVVLETGGLLAHGAILARECGIPAVAGVEGATSKIADNSRVRLDGNSGTVELL